MKSIYEIGTQIEMCHNKLLTTKMEISNELNNYPPNKDKIDKLSSKSMLYRKKIEELNRLKIEFIEKQFTD